MVSLTKLVLAASSLLPFIPAAPTSLRARDDTAPVKFTNTFPDVFCVAEQYGFHWEGGSGNYNLIATLEFDGQFSPHVSFLDSTIVSGPLLRDRFADIAYATPQCSRRTSCSTRPSTTTASSYLSLTPTSLIPLCKSAHSSYCAVIRAPRYRASALPSVVADTNARPAHS